LISLSPHQKKQVSRLIACIFIYIQGSLILFPATEEMEKLPRAVQMDEHLILCFHIIYQGQGNLASLPPEGACPELKPGAGTSLIG